MANHKPIWVADSETDPFGESKEDRTIPEPFVWGVYHGYDDTYYREFVGTGDRFTCTRADLANFVDFLSEQSVIIYAHNGGKFDWHFLSEFFESDQDILVINGRLARFQIGKCEFRDSFNLMPVALEQYNKMKFDYTKMHRAYRKDHMAEISKYLKSDCVNLWNMTHGFIENYGLHVTQAAAAMKYWQKMGNKVPRSGPTFYEKFRPFYFGGRVQCFEQGDFKMDALSIDINSAYPFAMLSDHPYGLQYYAFEGKPRKKMDKWGPMFFTIEVDSKGAFPYRGTNGSLYFPDDGVRRIYNVTGWELLAAIDTGTVDNVKFLEYIEFDETKNFSQYVNHFWELRQKFKDEGDDGGQFYCKIFLNALYGKFAADPRKYKNYKLRPRSALKSIIQEMGTEDTFRHFREWVIVNEKRGGSGKGKFYNLATAASITGYVRAMLWRSICAAERPLYCDTDSITAVAFGPEVTFSPVLGDWEIEYKYDRVIVGGKKLYAFHKAGESFDNKKSWKVASKGARLGFKELIKIAAGGVVEFNSMAPTFSVSKEGPVFVDREIKNTASDIRIVPRRFDPMFKEEIELEEKLAG